MLNLQSLQNIRNGVRASLAELHRTNNALNAKIDQFEADKSRSQAYVSENVKAARDAAMPGVGKALNSMREATAVAEAQREFWSSRPLLMSRAPFDADKAVDAALRVRYATELPLMGQPLVDLTQKNALAEGNLALAWACGQAGGSVDLTQVEIPGQAEALAAIVDCDAALAEAELIVGGMLGQTIDPARKLTIGRRMNPTRPTSHNSPDRAVA